MSRYPFKQAYIPASTLVGAFLASEREARKAIAGEPSTPATRELFWVVLGRAFRRYVEKDLDEHGKSCDRHNR